MYHSFLKPFYHDIKSLVLDTLFPIYCLACETEGSKFVCDACADVLTPLPQQFCIACQKMSVGGLTHPHCQSPHTADGLISVYDYHDEKVSNILIKGKYSFLPDVYKQLGIILADVIKKDFPFLLESGIYHLTPIPLHWMRQRWRGFNQSEILAQSLAQNLDSSCINVLVRCRFTKTQKNLKKPERIKNLESAFKLNQDTDVSNRNFILIDDVTTTGSTLHEAAKVLKRNGAAKIFCLTVARD